MENDFLFPSDKRQEKTIEFISTLLNNAKGRESFELQNNSTEECMKLVNVIMFGLKVEFNHSMILFICFLFHFICIRHFLSAYANSVDALMVFRLTFFAFLLSMTTTIKGMK